MTFTYDIATDVGKVRMLIPDRNGAQYMFEDAEIEAFLEMEGNVIRRATALALETMASDEAYVQKAIRLMDLSTDGPATARALLTRAALLRSQAADEAAATSTVSEFDVAEMIVNDFNARERLMKEALRRGI